MNAVPSPRPDQPHVIGEDFKYGWIDVGRGSKRKYRGQSVVECTLLCFLSYKKNPEICVVLCWPPTSWTLNFPREDCRKRDFLWWGCSTLVFVVLRSPRGGGGGGGLLLFPIIYFLCLNGAYHFTFSCLVLGKSFEDQGLLIWLVHEVFRWTDWCLCVVPLWMKMFA